MTFSQKNKKTYKDTSMAILTLYAKKKLHIRTQRWQLRTKLNNYITKCHIQNRLTDCPLLVKDRKLNTYITQSHVMLETLWLTLHAEQVIIVRQRRCVCWSKTQISPRNQHVHVGIMGEHIVDNQLIEEGYEIFERLSSLICRVLLCKTWIFWSPNHQGFEVSWEISFTWVITNLVMAGLWDQTSDISAIPFKCFLCSSIDILISFLSKQKQSSIYIFTDEKNVTRLVN